MSNRNSSNRPDKGKDKDKDGTPNKNDKSSGNPSASFTEALNWANRKNKDKKSSSGWISEHWNVLGIIIFFLIIITIIIFIYYGRKKKKKDNVLNNINNPNNILSPAVASPMPILRPPPIGNSQSPVGYDYQSPTTNYGQGNRTGESGGTVVPAMDNGGRQTGWWYYPSSLR